MTLSIAILCYYAACHYAVCRVLFIVRLNVIILSVDMLNVVAPYRSRIHYNNTSFSVIYKWGQKARVLIPGKPFQPSVMKHSSLLGPSITYGPSCLSNQLENTILLAYKV